MRYSYLENCHGDVLRVVKKEANKIELSPTLAKRRFEEVLYCLASLDWKVCPRIIAGIKLMLQNHVYVREGNDFPSYPLKVDDRIIEVDIFMGLLELSHPWEKFTFTSLVNDLEEEETLLIYTAQGSPFRHKKLSVINGSPEQQRTKMNELCIVSASQSFSRSGPDFNTNFV